MIFTHKVLQCSRCSNHVIHMVLSQPRKIIVLSCTIQCMGQSTYLLHCTYMQLLISYHCFDILCLTSSASASSALLFSSSSSSVTSLQFSLLCQHLLPLLQYFGSQSTLHLAARLIFSSFFYIFVCYVECDGGGGHSGNSDHEYTCGARACPNKETLKLSMMA